MRVPDSFLYGMLILLCLLLIGGLLAAITYREEGILEKSKNEEKKTEKDRKQEDVQEIIVNNPNIRVLYIRP